MRLETRRIIAAMLVMLAIIPVVAVGAIPVQPHKFWGAVTIDGVSATDGTLVEAKIAGITYASESTVDGKYGYNTEDLFYVPADNPDTPAIIEGGVDGDTIKFYVGGILATTYTFEKGGSTNLPLAITTAVYELQLYEGWNLIGIPGIPEDPSITVMLYDIIGYVESVWAYDGETGYWSSYSPSVPSDLTEMVDGDGYWISMTASATLTVSGTEMPEDPFAPLPAYPVVEGWNLVGFKSTSAKTVSEYLLGVDYVRVYEYVAGYNSLSASDYMMPGRGYWIAVSEAGTIYP